MDTSQVNKKSLISKENWSLVRVQLVAAIIGLLLIVNYQQHRLDFLFYDQLITHFHHSTDNKVAVVEVDDKSLALLGEWPWSRDIHADLLNNLSKANVKAVGFDILFTQNRYSNSVQDASFALAIKQAGNVVLPIAPSKSRAGGNVELLPQVELAQAAQKLGHVDYEFDIDGMVRSSFLYAGYQSARWPSFALALSQIAEPTVPYQTSGEASGSGWTRQDQIFINYSGAEKGGRLPNYSYIDVLTNKVAPEKLAGKVILIGMNATGLGDQFPTPISYQHQTMPGVEINAHLVNSIMNQNEIKKIDKYTTGFITLVLFIFSFALLYFVKNKPLLPFLTVCLAIPAIVSIALFQFKHLWFAPSLIWGLQIILFALIDLTRSKLIKSKIKSLTHKIEHDTSTHLLNENGFIEYCVHTQQSKEQQIIVVQVGKFGGMSGLLGEHVSRQLLAQMKQRLNEFFANDEEIVARLSGFEFAVQIHNVSKDQLVDLCNELIEGLSQPYFVEQHYQLPAYIGISNHAEINTKELAKELLNNARTAKQIAKNGVLSRFCFFTQDIKENYELQTKLESELSQALANNQIEINYQPQVIATNNKIVGAEALVRWRHPERGLVRPDHFIPIAEKTGLIVDLGRWVIQQACKQAKYWQVNGNPGFRVAVNISAVQFADKGLVSDVENALKEAELEAKYLELELTESGIIEDMAQAVQTLNSLKQLGVELAIDDFGTGYSSLSYLKQFPIDRIKINKSFVQEVTESNNAQELTLAIISMAHSLGMKVIAEGIESEQQQEFLYSNKCEEMQGYYFGKPESVDKINELLKTIRG
jgi:EAL domain-containing protein (putative c-di-GMP-specific phosphodiesterase class I)/CHASE2 domain-containing sensor protein/GGDEF domain-containing protein